MHDGTYNMALAAAKERIAALEQVVKDAAALLTDIPGFDAVGTYNECDAWCARRVALLKRIEQENP